MSYKDKYTSLQSAYGSSFGDAFKNSSINKLNSSFTDSPFYRQIDIDGTLTDVRLVQDDITSQKKTLLFKPNTTINVGSVATINGQKWMVMDYFDNEIYPKANIQLCSTLLKWLDDDGVLKQYSCIIELPSRMQPGIADDKTMILPDGKRRITLQSNADVAKIQRDKRFIFDGRAWIVTDIDSLTTMGLYVLTVVESQLDDKDNLSLGIADYYGKVANYTITILNGEHFSIRAGTILQLNAEVRNNGVIVTHDVEWLSSNVSIATVSSTGLLSSIANGDVTITAKLKDDPTVQDTTTVTIELDNTSNYSVSIAESPVVRVNNSVTFNAVVRNNNVIDNTKQVQWYLYDADGVSTPIAATMTFSSTTQCTIKGIKVGTVKLKVVLVGQTSTFTIIPIKITSLI